MAKKKPDGRYVGVAVEAVVVTGGSTFDALTKTYVASGMLTTFRDADGNIVKPAWAPEHFGKKIEELIRLKISPIKYFIYQENK